MTEARKPVQELLADVVRELPPIPKDQVNEAQHFKFRSIENVLEKARPLLARAGVLFVPDVVERLSETRTTSKGAAMNVVHLHVRYRIVGPGGDYLEASGWGEGADSGDKGTNKAMTAAFKYVLTQVLLVAEAEADPDRGGVDAAPASERPARPEQLTRIRSAAAERGLDVAELLTRGGLDSLDQLSVDRADRMLAYIVEPAG